MKRFYETLETLAAQDNQRILADLSHFKQSDSKTRALRKFNYLIERCFKNHPGVRRHVRFMENAQTPAKDWMLETYAYKIYQETSPVTTPQELIHELNSKSLLQLLKLKSTTPATEGPVAEIAHHVIDNIYDDTTQILHQSLLTDPCFFSVWNEQPDSELTHRYSLELLQASELGNICHLFELTQQFKEEANRKRCFLNAGRSPVANLQIMQERLLHLQQVLAKAPKYSTQTLKERNQQWQKYTSHSLMGGK